MEGMLRGTLTNDEYCLPNAFLVDEVSIAGATLFELLAPKVIMGTDPCQPLSIQFMIECIILGIKGHLVLDHDGHVCFHGRQYFPYIKLLEPLPFLPCLLVLMIIVIPFATDSSANHTAMC
jgi:hypothetical protein